MLKPNKQQIIKLLKEGFKAELISFEFEIPINEIYSLKKELDKPKTVTRYEGDFIGKREKRKLAGYQKFQMMRDKYKSLYHDLRPEECKTEKKKTFLEDREKVDKTIDIIQGILNSMNEEQTEKQKMKKAFAVLKEIKNAYKYQFTLEQIERMIAILQSAQMRSLRIENYNDRNQYSNLYNKRKYEISEKYMQAIVSELDEINDKEELKRLREKISTIPFGINRGIAECVKSRINRMLQKDSQQAVLERIKNDIPENILEIVSDLSNGKLDIEYARRIIREESEKRVKSKKQNKFTLTEEQEKNQILFQIRTALEERGSRYRIINPSVTVRQLHSLTNDNLTQSISSVVENLINSKLFEEAKKVYKEFSIEIEDDENSEYMRSIRKKIRNSEIGDMILKGINKEGTLTEDDRCFELIEKGLKLGNVKMQSINLGKSQSGLRTITLADIWPEKEKARYFY